MEYQKIINLFDNAPNKPTRFWTKNQFEINNDARGTYNNDSQVKFKTSKLKSSLCDDSDEYVIAKGTVTIAPVPPPAANPNNNNKEVVFKNCAPNFTFIHLLL